MQPAGIVLGHSGLIPLKQESDGYASSGLLNQLLDNGGVGKSIDPDLDLALSGINGRKHHVGGIIGCDADSDSSVFGRLEWAVEAL